MPLYEYRCTGCGKRIEALQRVSAPPLRECPTCHGVLEKLVSAPSLQFKGTGWYVTDYGKGRGRKADEGKGSDESPKKDAAPSAAPGADSKSADSKSGDSKSGDSKSGDSKSGDSKSGDSTS